MVDQSNWGWPIGWRDFPEISLWEMWGQSFALGFFELRLHSSIGWVSPTEFEHSPVHGAHSKLPS